MDFFNEVKYSIYNNQFSLLPKYLTLQYNMQVDKQLCY